MALAGFAANGDVAAMRGAVERGESVCPRRCEMAEQCDRVHGFGWRHECFEEAHRKPLSEAYN